MERADRPSIAFRRADVFEIDTHRGGRVAGTRFSSAGSALEETATRGFDFMEDRPLDAREKTGRAGARGAPRGDKQAAPGSALSSGRRVASLFELLQELSSPRAQSSTTPRGEARPRGTACPPATTSLLERTSASGKSASTRALEASSAADRHEAGDEADGTRLRSVSGQESSPAENSLCGPARPALRREDEPRNLSSKEARRVTFAGTREEAWREHTTIGTAAAPPSLPPSTLLDEQWQKSGSATTIPSRPKRPTGIQGVGSPKGRRPHIGPAQGAPKRIALGNVTPGNARGESRAPVVLAGSAARSEVLPKMASSVGHYQAGEEKGRFEERSAKRRRDPVRELHRGGSKLAGAASRPESRRRDVVGVGRFSGGEPARGRGGDGDGRVSPAERAVERMPRVGTGSKQGAPQGEFGALPDQGSVAVSPWTNQGHTTGGMYMWQDTRPYSEQQRPIESRSQFQVPEAHNAGQVRGVRPLVEGAESAVENGRQGGRGVSAAAEAAVADTDDSAFTEKHSGGPTEREVRSLDDGEQEWSCDTGAGDNAEQEEGDNGDPKRELVRVRGLCHMRGTILALVEWSAVDAEGATCTELSFMLSSALKADWPQQYITFLEERMVFDTENEACPTPGNARGNPASAVAEPTGSELEVWKSGGSTTSRLPT